MEALVRARSIILLVLAALGGGVEAELTYQTFDVPGAVGFGPVNPFDVTSSEFFIHGINGDPGDPADDVDADFTAGFGANPNGSLSYVISTSLPGGVDIFSFFTATATFNEFVISSDSVTVSNFDVPGFLVNTNGFDATAVDLKTDPHFFQFNLDQTMTGQYTQHQDFGFGFFQDILFEVNGGYVLNQAGLDDATTTAFGAVNPAAAAYLNEVVANHAPGDWTQAGIWIVDQDYTVDNTADNTGALLGGHADGYNIWFSTDPFIFGNPLADPTPGDPISPDDLAQMVIDGIFPDIGGLLLPGDVAVQVWDIALLSGDGSPQDFTFEYDEALLPSGFDETLLRIAHYVDGVWEIPGGQIVDPDGNTISFTIDSFSPFALTAVPIPAALYMFGSALLLVDLKLRRNS